MRDTVYGIDDYGKMINCRPRMDAYEKALRAAVRPGSVVLDIGTGTGIFALLACRFGARRVYAVETSAMIQVAREIAVANGYAETIRFLQGSTTDLRLPEPVDVIVADLRGVMPLYRQSVTALIDARRRFLAPGGTMIPKRDEIWIAPIEAPEISDRIANPWTRNSYGLDMRAAEGLAANLLAPVSVEPAQMLSAAVLCGAIDYASVEDANFVADVTVRVARAGTCHGLGAWFDAVLAAGIGYSNSPDVAEIVHGRFLFRWPRAVAVEAGDSISVRLGARLSGGDYVWTWNSSVREGDGGATKASFRQSTFLSNPLTTQMLRAISADHVPDLGDEGAIDALILDRMRDRIALGEIARSVAEQHPGRFANWQEALRRVAELSLRYGRPAD